MQKTKIEWADMTWNPVTGCLNECPFCYAKKIAERFGGHGNTMLQYESEYSDKGLKEQDSPLTVIRRGNKEVVAPFPYMFAPTFHKYRLDQPQKIRNPQRIFVVSMGDLFGWWVPDEWIIQVFDACKAAPQHRYMFLTKFPERYVVLAQKKLIPILDNFWYGQSKSEGNVFSQYGSYHQFLSAEPLFGEVNPCGFELVILGAETGNRKEKKLPDPEEVSASVLNSFYNNAKVFMKDSLVQIVGEERMFRQMPKGLQL